MMIAASYRLAFLSNPRLLIGILSRGEKRRLPPPCVCVYTYVRGCVYFFRSLLAACHLEKPCLGGGKGGIRTERRINNTRGHVRVKIDYGAGENVINSWTNKEGTCVRAK